MCNKLKIRSEKSFNNLVSGIKSMYKPGEINDAEARAASRRVIKFFQILLEVQDEMEKEQENQIKDEKTI